MRSQRLEFSRATKNEAYERSKRGGVAICECHRVPQLNRPHGCGVVLRSGAIFYEHIQQAELRGGNDVDNCAALAKTCWREKTDTVDLPEIAKANRRRDRDRNSRTLPWAPMAGTKRSGIKKPLRPWSRPIDRTTGQEL